MRSLARPMALVGVCGLALLCSACGGNKSKIVGKWKMRPDTKGTAPDLEPKITPYMEFNKDGTFKIGVEVDPAMQEKMGKFAEVFAFAGKYTVNGDVLELQPNESGDKGGVFKGENKAKIRFDGSDKLIVTVDGKDSTLSRMK